jgi:hypothetical protein
MSGSERIGEPFEELERALRVVQDQIVSVATRGPTEDLLYAAEDARNQLQALIVELGEVLP